MSRVLSIAFSLVMALACTAARADKFTDAQPSYVRIASQCGEDPSRPSFSASDYAAALADAAKALKTAGKQGSRDQINAINKWVTDLKDCQEQEVTKFVLPQINNCGDFVVQYYAYMARVYQLIISTKGKFSFDGQKRVQEMFRKPAMECVRHLMTKCIDPNDTRSVDFVIQVMEIAARFGFIKSYAAETGLSRWLIEHDNSVPKMRFCTDTDYSCKGDRQACSDRTTQIKAIMQTFLDE